MTALPLTRRLAMAIGAATLLAGCASMDPGHAGPGSYDIRAGLGAPVAAAPVETMEVRDSIAGRSYFGTVSPPRRVGQQLKIDVQLPFGLQLDDRSQYDIAVQKLESARQTGEFRERWMDEVDANNTAARQGHGSALMVGLDPDDIKRTYSHLHSIAFGQNAQAGSEMLMRSYRDTLAARQDTALLLQADPSLENFQDYARFEMGRRLLGHVLVERKVLVNRAVEQDFASTYGLLEGVQYGLHARQDANFGSAEVMLADDAAQRPRINLEGPMLAENQYMQRTYGEVRYEVDRWVQLDREAARRNAVQTSERPAVERRVP